MRPSWQPCWSARSVEAVGTNQGRRGKRPEKDQRALELYEELGSYRLVSERLQTEGITASRTTVSTMVQRAMSRRFEHSLDELDSRDKETIEEIRTRLTELRDAWNESLNQLNEASALPAEPAPVPVAAPAPVAQPLPVTAPAPSSGDYTGLSLMG